MIYFLQELPPKLSQAQSLHAYLYIALLLVFSNFSTPSKLSVQRARESLCNLCLSMHNRNSTRLIRCRSAPTHQIIQVSMRAKGA
jgi:hypothetical protein